MDELNYTAAAGDSGRLDQLVRRLTGRSRADLKGLFHAGGVELNGQPCRSPGARVQPGDKVLVRHEPHTRYRRPPPERINRSFRTVFEDEHLLVVDKAAAILTVPTVHGETRTLVHAVARYLHRRTAMPLAVHRLDRGTSGLLVFGKSPQIAKQLQDQFRVRKAEREYIAIVAGHVSDQEGTITSRLATDKRLQRFSVGPGEAGELAISEYRVERRIPGATVVRVLLKTGRRNQIRVQFAEAGHPVLGDPRYRPSEAAHPAWKSKRLALHAAVLGLVHPVTGESLRFETPAPVEFERFISRVTGK